MPAGAGRPTAVEERRQEIVARRNQRKQGQAPETDIKAARTAANAVTNAPRKKILLGAVEELEELRRRAIEKDSRRKSIEAREREFQKSRRVTLPGENRGVILPDDVQAGDILKLKDGRIFKLRDADILEQISD